jgi:hypothetical protein
MQFAQLVCSSFKLAFRIQERLERGEGCEDTSAARVSTSVLAIIVAGCSIPSLMALLNQGLATQELLQEQICPAGGTCRCDTSQVTTCPPLLTTPAQAMGLCVLHI